MSTINKKIWLCLLASITSSYTMHVQAADCAIGGTENTAITASTAQLIDNNNGTITDPQTGLVWKKCSEGQAWSSADNNCDDAANTAIFTWQNAMQRAQDVNNGAGQNFGQTDWRLPNIKELASIVEVRCNNPAINNTVFPETPGGSFWSSSSYASNAGDAWDILFTTGINTLFRKEGGSSVRLVRSGQ